MNINLEDINQSNQKQDVINSSNSDIGDQGGDTSVEYGAGNNGAGGSSHPAKQEAQRAIGDVEAAHQLLANDILDTSNELLREVDGLEHEAAELYGDEGQPEVDIDIQQSL